jgi:hypothetical protein
MPNNSSYADIIRDWEKLLASVQGDAADLPTAEPHRLALQQTLDQIKTLKTRQDTLQATRQETTQDLNKLVVQAREQAIRLRGVVRAEVGPKSERLVQFGVAPLRKRSRAAKTPPATQPAVPPAPHDPAHDPAK